MRSKIYLLFLLLFHQTLLAEMFRMMRSSSFLSTTAICSAATVVGFQTKNTVFANCAPASSSLSSFVARPPRSPLVSLKDKVVLITGATAGIGLACAWRFADENAKLVLVGRRNDRLNAVKDAILKEYPKLKIHTVAMSVTDYDEVAALPKKLPNDFKDVDILVNNAGLARGVTKVEDNSMSDAIEVMETNVLGTIAFTAAFVPRMKERGCGHIVNMGSVAVSSSLWFSCLF
jgi:NADPH:quinone reductase-like Zn-dependent oxidoreductase